jgi:hypothetical protein
MELRNFISQALLDVMGGVEDAQKKTPVGGAIAPLGFYGGWKSSEDLLKFQEVTNMQAVEFEVTVRAEERSGSGAKLNVVAGIIGGGVKGESGKCDGHVATLKFKVPIMLPQGKTGKVNK